VSKGPRKDDEVDFQDLIHARYSCRAYHGQPVEDEKLDMVLQAGRLAPTAANRQAFKLYVLPAARHQEALRRLYPREWFVQAPLVVGIAGEPARNWVRKDGRNYLDVDCAIVMDHVILQAADLGLGTCWIGAFDPAEARVLLALPPEWEPIAFTPLGYPADEPRPRQRKPLEDLVVRL
jgi:nitroreductase